MVKTPKTRHSKLRRDPVTIDLGPEEVSRFEQAKPAADDVPADTTTPAAAASDGPHPQEAAPDDGLPPEPAVAKRLEEDIAGDRDFQGEDVKASTQSEPRYASGFGRSPGATVDSESELGQEQTEPQAAPAAARRAHGLVAGLVGGLIALAGAGGLQFAGLLPSPGNGGNVNAAGLQMQIEALRQEIDGLRKAPGAGGAEDLRQALGDSATRVDGLSTTVDQLKADLAGLRGTVEAGGTGDGAAVQALDAKIKEIEASLATLGQNGGASAAALDAIDQKIASVEAGLGAATKAVAAADARLATLEQNVAGLLQKVEAQADQPRIALAIAASALKAAVDRGGPFASEVETFAAVAPNAPELPELRVLADKGAPSRADLAAAMPGAATAMIDAGKVVDVNAGFFERLLSSAESLVKVRPIGAVEGEGVPAKVARMEAALRDGNLAKALAEYDSLPEPAKAAGPDFADAVRSRIKAEELVDKALAGALKAS